MRNQSAAKRAMKQNTPRVSMLIAGWNQSKLLHAAKDREISGQSKRRHIALP